MDCFVVVVVISLTRISNRMLNKNDDEGGHVYLIVDLKSNAFNVSPIRIIFLVEFFCKWPSSD